MKRILLRAALILALVLAAAPAQAQYKKDKLLNRPYADNRAWHLGFSVGLHTEGFLLTNNGAVTIGPGGEEQRWFAEQSSYQPGFCVNGLVAFRLNNYFSVRLSPGLWFGSRKVTFLDQVSGVREKQDVKSTYIVVPLDLKFAAQRWRNLRPYVVGGVMPAFDIGKKPDQALVQLKTTDVFLTVGFGCDFYLPFFKLNPEVKFCFGLSNVLKTDRPDLADMPDRMNFTNSLSKVTSNMVVLSFYFE